MNPTGSPREDDVQTLPVVVTANKITASRVIPSRFSYKRSENKPLLFKNHPRRLQLTALDPRGVPLSLIAGPEHTPENAGDTPDPGFAANREFEKDLPTTDPLWPPV